MILAVDFLKTGSIELAEFSHNRCANHVLNLAVQAGLNFDEIKLVIERIRFFCKKVHCSSKLSSELSTYQRSKDEPLITVVMDVETRWNSTHDMLSTAKRIHKSLTTISINHATDRMPSLTIDDWAIADNIIFLLEPFYQSNLKYIPKCFLLQAQLTSIIKAFMHFS